MSKRYLTGPKWSTLFSPEKKLVISESRLIEGRNIIYNVLEQMESVYASNIQLLKFSTFTEIFENHLRLDLQPQPQQPQPQTGARYQLMSIKSNKMLRFSSKNETFLKIYKKNRKDKIGRRLGVVVVPFSFFLVQPKSRVTKRARPSASLRLEKSYIESALQ